MIHIGIITGIEVGVLDLDDMGLGSLHGMIHGTIHPIVGVTMIHGTIHLIVGVTTIRGITHLIVGDGAAVIGDLVTGMVAIGDIIITTMTVIIDHQLTATHPDRWVDHQEVQDIMVRVESETIPDHLVVDRQA